jgi:RHS repeat-associated protein
VLYSYDNIGQLAVATSSASSENRGYAYDHAWNLQWLTNNGTASAYQVNVDNELTNVASRGLKYDANGNLTNKVTDSGGDYNAYIYDDENRLIDVQNLSIAYETVFIYDGLGRLRIRQEYEWAAEMIMPLVPTAGLPLVNVVNYIYDGWRVIQERNSNNVPQVSYTRGPDLSGSLQGAGGIGGLLARSSGYSSGNWTSHDYYHADGNGNITCLVDTNQSLVASYRYDPYGNTLSESGTLAATNVYRFSSKEVHVNSGMYYYGYRFYDPGLQRWINRDPIGEKLGINLYGFVGNDSVDRRDRNGLDAASDCARKCDTQYANCLFQWNKVGGVVFGGLGGVLIAVRKVCWTTGVGMMFGTLWRVNDCASTLFGCLSMCPPTTPYPTAPPGSGCSLCPVNTPPVIYGH